MVFCSLRNETKCWLNMHYKTIQNYAKKCFKTANIQKIQLAICLKHNIKYQCLVLSLFVENIWFKCSLALLVLGEARGFKHSSFNLFKYINIFYIYLDFIKHKVCSLIISPYRARSKLKVEMKTQFSEILGNTNQLSDDVRTEANQPNTWNFQ